jgi:cation diffusion facilitator family transporter
MPSRLFHTGARRLYFMVDEPATMAQTETIRTAANRKVSAARLSIYSNTMLVVLKLVVGVLSGSVSVLSEAAHSASDLLASWIAFFSVRVSDLPADEQHPYGHGKIESISGLAEALLIFGAAAYIIYEAIHKLIKGVGQLDVNLCLAVMFASVLVNTMVSIRLFKVARDTDSLALEADAEHLRTDVYTSLGVFIGLVVVRLTGLSIFDPIVAIGVAMLIFHAAWRLSRAAFGGLVDTVLPAEDTAVVRAILDDEPAVLGYHRVRTRKSGSARHIDAHVQMADTLTLFEAHEFTERIEDRIRLQLPHAIVTIHTEPYQAEQRHQYEEHGGPPPDESDANAKSSRLTGGT